MNVVQLRDLRGYREEFPPEEPETTPSSESVAIVTPEVEQVETTDSLPEASPPQPNESPWARMPIVFIPVAIAKAIYITIRACCFALTFCVQTAFRYLYKHPIHAVLNVLFVAVLAILISTGSDLHTQMILSKISSETVDNIIAGSRFTRQFDAEEINRGGVRELLRVGAPTWTQREGVRAILYHARKAGLGIEDQAVLLAIADVESGFNPMARASTTTACGLFQFVRRTGESFSLNTGECMDPWLNAESGVKHYIYNFERRVRPSVEKLSGAERVFRTFELSYYLHHDGSDYTGSPSNDVKATILNGTQFLFKAYHALENEAESQEHVPAFSETLSAKVWSGLDNIQSIIGDFEIFGLQSAHASGKPEDHDEIEN